MAIQILSALQFSPYQSGRSSSTGQHIDHSDGGPTSDHATHIQPFSSVIDLTHDEATDLTLHSRIGFESPDIEASALVLFVVTPA
jgi:hypothetical protein